MVRLKLSVENMPTLVFYIEFESEGEADRFEALSRWAVKREKKQVSIDAVKEKVGTPEVLALLHTEAILIRKVELQTASLEDIFMKVVMEE